MTRHENILSFDEARTRGSSSLNRASVRTSSSQQPVRSSVRSSKNPQRLSYDASFEQSFTATARSGSYSRSSRPQSHPVPTQQVRDTRVSQSSSSHRASASRYSMPSVNASPVRSGSTSSASQSSTSQRHVEKTRSNKQTLSHRMRAAKAERQFNKTFSSDEAGKANAEQSSRPALYEMKMGKTHKRSSRMQNESSHNAGKNGSSGRMAGFFAILNPRSGRFSSRMFIACITLVLAGVMLYQPLANYYQEIRQQQQLEAEYEAVSEYYASLKSEVDYLNTEEGLEEYVRQELGWVKEGEQVVSVEGLDTSDSSATKSLVTSDLSDTVSTPETWYSPVLDVVFGYNKA